ncbi:MAG: HAMP domain-containing protein [Deltaproteobacteria bacterium]|nr:HAMP domain-containing protein [Deltaproteobacteria bacterium]
MALSVRPKLTIWYIGTVSLLLLFFVGADMVGLRRNLMSRAAAAASSAVDSLAQYLETAPSGWQGNAQDRARVGKLMERQLGGQRALAAVLRPTSSEPLFLLNLGGLPEDRVRRLLAEHAGSRSGRVVVVQGENFRVVSRAQAGPERTRYVALVALSVEDRVATWRQAIGEHGLLALVLVALVSVLSYLVIKRAFAPVRRLTAEVRTITAADLSLRADASGDRYEIGELAATFNAVIARLEGAFDRLRRFSGDVAHELKTPLAVLRAELDRALRRDRSAEDYQQSLKRLRAELDRIVEIVENLLVLSGAEVEQLARREQPVAFDHTVMTVYEDLLALARQAGLCCELDELAEVQVQGDPQLLERMVANLLHNAIKFTPAGGKVTVSLRAEDERFALSVVDNGVGIPPQDLPRIFDRFYRADKSRSKRTGGAGLGLAIVQQIAKIHGFELGVSSEPNRRTEFRVVGRTIKQV